jgi:hypothetical protein
MRKKDMDLDLVSGLVTASRSGETVRNKVRHATAPKRNEEEDNMLATGVGLSLDSERAK